MIRCKKTTNAFILIVARNFIGRKLYRTRSLCCLSAALMADGNNTLHPAASLCTRHSLPPPKLQEQDGAGSLAAGQGGRCDPQRHHHTPTRPRELAQRLVRNSELSWKTWLVPVLVLPR